MYAFIGLSISMYFSSQGAAKVLGPVLAQTARLVFVGGRRLVAVDARRDRREFLHAGGGIDGGARRAVGRERDFTRWGPKPASVPQFVRGCRELTPSFRGAPLRREPGIPINNLSIPGSREAARPGMTLLFLGRLVISSRVAPELLLHRRPPRDPSGRRCKARSRSATRRWSTPCGCGPRRRRTPGSRRCVA